MTATELMLASNVREGYSMVQAADRLMKLYKEGLIPKTNQDVQLAFSNYVTGRIDALTAITRIKNLLDYDLLYWNQLVEREKAIAQAPCHHGNGGDGAERPAGFRGEARRTRHEERHDEEADRMIVIAAAIAAAALIFYFSGPGKSATNPVSASAAAAQEKTGSMPGMPGMAAEKPKAPQAAGRGRPSPRRPTVEIPAEKQQMIGVKTATAQVLPLMKTIRTVGLVEYDQRRLNTINTKVEGWIEKLYVNFTGTYVKKGRPGRRHLQPRAVGDPAGVHQRREMGQRGGGERRRGRRTDCRCRRRAGRERHDRQGRAVPRRGRAGSA